MKPNFQTMSLKELRAFVLEHRDDEEAFQAMVDRYGAEYPNRVSYPPPKTPEEREAMQRLIQEKLGQ